MVAFAPMLAALASMNSSTAMLQTGVELVSGAVMAIGQAFKTVFNKAVEKAIEIGHKIKDFYDEHLADALAPFLEGARTVLSFVIEQFRKAISLIVGIVRDIPGAFTEKLGEVKDFILGIPETLGNVFRGVLGRVGGFIGNIISKIGGFKDKAVGLFRDVGDILMKPFKAVWGIISKIIDAIKNTIGKFVDKVGGFFGKKKDDAGGGAGSTARTVIQSMTQNFSITVNMPSMAGMTNRESAREQADLILQEIARKTGGTTQSGRYA